VHNKTLFVQRVCCVKLLKFYTFCEDNIVNDKHTIIESVYIVNDKHTIAEIEFDSFIMCQFLLAMKYAVSCFSKPFHSVGEIYLFI
jgi:hypothetical protein